MAAHLERRGARGQGIRRRGSVVSARENTRSASSGRPVCRWISPRRNSASNCMTASVPRHMAPPREPACLMQMVGCSNASLSSHDRARAFLIAQCHAFAAWIGSTFIAAGDGECR